MQECTLLDSTKMTTRLMDALKTPPSMAAAAHMAYRPGWICQVGSHLISSSPQTAPKDPPTCAQMTQSAARKSRNLLPRHIAGCSSIPHKGTDISDSCDSLHAKGGECCGNHAVTYVWLYAGSS